MVFQVGTQTGFYRMGQCHIGKKSIEAFGRQSVYRRADGFDLAQKLIALGIINELWNDFVFLKDILSHGTVAGQRNDSCQHERGQIGGGTKKTVIPAYQKAQSQKDQDDQINNVQESLLYIEAQRSSGMIRKWDRASSR